MIQFINQSPEQQRKVLGSPGQCCTSIREVRKDLLRIYSSTGVKQHRMRVDVVSRCSEGACNLHACPEASVDTGQSKSQSDSVPVMRLIYQVAAREDKEGTLRKGVETPTCQQQPVLRDPLNWLQQVVLQGQVGTSRAHLKGKTRQSK